MPRRKKKRKKSYVKSTVIFEGEDIKKEGTLHEVRKDMPVEELENDAKAMRPSHGLVRAALEVNACHMCGRTILAGEKSELYESPQKDHLRICAICRPQARGSGFSLVA